MGLIVESGINKSYDNGGIMDVSNTGFLVGDLEPKIADGNLRFNKGKFLEFEVVKPLEKNRSDADLYLIKKDNNEFLLTLYKSGITAPRDILLQAQSLSRHEENHFALILQCGYSEEYERDYSITRLSEFGTLRSRRIRNYKRLIRQVVIALETAHENDILHLDLRLDDIIIENINPNNYSLYGLGHKRVENSDSCEEIATIKGMGKYQAPEVIHCKGRAKSDFWSLGVILFEVIVGKYPFAYEKNNYGNYEINYKEYTIPDFVEERYRELIDGLLTINTRNRWGIDKVKEWLMTNVDDKKVDTYQTEKFVYKDVEYENLDDLHEHFAFTPYGYGELEKLYFRGHITKWLADTNNLELLKELEESLANKYLFNRYIYKYWSEDRELYFKGFDLTKYDNLKMLSETDINKIADFLPPLNKKVEEIRDSLKNDTQKRLANKSRIDKDFFYYGYIDNRDLYLDGKKASTYKTIPNFDIVEDKSIRTFLKFREEYNFDSIDNYLRELVKSRKPLENIKESIDKYQLPLLFLNNNIIEKAHDLVRFKEEQKGEFDLFKKLYEEYKFLPLSFRDMLIEKSNLDFYNYYIEKEFERDYFLLFEKLKKKYEEESLLKYLTFATYEELIETIPSTADIPVENRDYIKFQLEVLDYILTNKLYQMGEYEVEVKVTGLARLFGKKKKN